MGNNTPSADEDGTIGSVSIYGDVSDNYNLALGSALSPLMKDGHLQVNNENQPLVRGALPNRRKSTNQKGYRSIESIGSILPKRRRASTAQLKVTVKDRIISAPVFRGRYRSKSTSDLKSGVDPNEWKTIQAKSKDENCGGLSDGDGISPIEPNTAGTVSSKDSESLSLLKQSFPWAGFDAPVSNNNGSSLKIQRRAESSVSSISTSRRLQITRMPSDLSTSMKNISSPRKLVVGPTSLSRSQLQYNSRGSGEPDSGIFSVSNDDSMINSQSFANDDLSIHSNIDMDTVSDYVDEMVSNQIGTKTTKVKPLLSFKQAFSHLSVDTDSHQSRRFRHAQSASEKTSNELSPLSSRSVPGTTSPSNVRLNKNSERNQNTNTDDDENDKTTNNDNNNNHRRLSTHSAGQTNQKYELFKSTQNNKFRQKGKSSSSGIRGRKKLGSASSLSSSRSAMLPLTGEVTSPVIGNSDSSHNNLSQHYTMRQVPYSHGKIIRSSSRDIASPSPPKSILMQSKRLSLNTPATATGSSGNMSDFLDNAIANSGNNFFEPKSALITDLGSGGSAKGLNGKLTVIPTSRKSNMKTGRAGSDFFDEFSPLTMNDSDTFDTLDNDTDEGNSGVSNKNEIVEFSSKRQGKYHRGRRVKERPITPGLELTDRDRHMSYTLSRTGRKPNVVGRGNKHLNMKNFAEFNQLDAIEKDAENKEKFKVEVAQRRQRDSIGAGIDADSFLSFLMDPSAGAMDEEMNFTTKFKRDNQGHSNVERTSGGRYVVNNMIEADETTKRKRGRRNRRNRYMGAKTSSKVTPQMKLDKAAEEEKQSNVASDLMAHKLFTNNTKATLKSKSKLQRTTSSKSKSSFNDTTNGLNSLLDQNVQQSNAALQQRIVRQKRIAKMKAEKRKFNKKERKSDTVEALGSLAHEKVERNILSTVKNLFSIGHNKGNKKKKQSMLYDDLSSSSDDGDVTKSKTKTPETLV
eukprot:TRINITY_DN230763_c2_g1_i2.p1 TRINITY_DN230763_c2_g1~~TRINITY_DN230763_c2_g1_i2.p1  ORF type:complete len:968 (+),score=265.69 TRINITY_DN230763_c2_g1_i2:261-3164(+)